MTKVEVLAYLLCKSAKRVFVEIVVGFLELVAESIVGILPPRVHLDILLCTRRERTLDFGIEGRFFVRRAALLREARIEPKEGHGREDDTRT